MRIKKHQQTIIMIVIVVFTMVGFGFFVKESISGHKMVRENNFSKNQREQGRAPELSTSNLDISDWKTYVNKDYGFEVKYPNDWGRNEFKKGEPREDPITAEFASFFNDQSNTLKFFIYVEKKDDFKGFSGDFQQDVTIIKNGNDIKLYNNHVSRMATVFTKDNLVYLIYWATNTNGDARVFEEVVKSFYFLN